MRFSASLSLSRSRREISSRRRLSAEVGRVNEGDAPRLACPGDGDLYRGRSRSDPEPPLRRRDGAPDRRPRSSKRRPSLQQRPLSERALQHHQHAPLRPAGAELAPALTNLPPRPVPLGRCSKTRARIALRFLLKTKPGGIHTFAAALFFSDVFILFFQRFKGVRAKGPKIECTEIASAFCLPLVFVFW